MRSLFLKNFSLIAVLVVLSFTVLGASYVIMGRTYAITEKRNTIKVNAQAMAQTAAAFSANGLLDSRNFGLVLDTVSGSTGNVIIVTDVNGFILSYSERIYAQDFDKQLNAAVMESVREATKYGNLYDGISSDGSFYYVAAPVIVNSSTITAYIFVGSDLSSILSAWSKTSRTFIVLAMAVMFLALSMSYYASKRQAEPLNEMAAAARRFARGDFAARVTNYGAEDEIGALTESFNSMAESLEKSEQLRSEFIANVSHELKTPMTTISGFADGILDGTIPEAEQDKYLAVISSETKRLSRLVRQMLQMSRIQTVDPDALLSRSFDLSEVIVRTLVNFESKINSNGLDVDAQLPEERILVRGDEDSLTQVVYNLLDNAVKFAEKGSTISISLWKQDGKAYVSVENRGETIIPEELPFIFDRFHKMDKSRSLNRDGVGLGLSIVKTILNNHNEDISVTSRDGVTRFVFTASLKEGK